MAARLEEERNGADFSVEEMARVIYGGETGRVAHKCKLEALLADPGLQV
jgi:hypothetical protein